MAWGMSDVVEQLNRLTRPAIVLGASALALVVGLALTTQAPDAGTVVLFGALFAFAANSDVEGPSGTAVSAGFMIVTAAIVVFATAGTPLGVALVGLCGAVVVPHVVHLEWRKLLCNAGTHVVSMSVGVAVLLSLPDHWLREFPLLLAGTTLAALAAFAANVPCVGLGIAYVYRRPARDVVLALATRQWLVYPFAVLGTGLGWLELHHGAVVLILTVTPILVGRQAFASYMRFHEANEATLDTLVRALEAKDRYTAGHAERVAAYSRYIGEELGLGPRALERLRAAALMHDVGKLIVPNHLLNKPGRLTAAEYERMRRHEEVTVELLGRIDFLAPVAPIAIGVYAPLDENGRRHPIERQIVAVADAYDAMTSTRAYRRALAQDVAFAELQRNAGTQFHPRCVDGLIATLQRRGLQHGAGYEPAEAADDWDVAPPEAGPGSAGLGDLADHRAH